MSMPITAAAPDVAHAQAPGPWRTSVLMDTQSRSAGRRSAGGPAGEKPEPTAAPPGRRAVKSTVEWLTVSAVRLCSKVSCSRSAAATMTYVHADACVVIGPLARRAEPGAHDLCAEHAARLTPPVDWELIRIEGAQTPPERTHDDLLAIADAVREAAGRSRTRTPEATRTGVPADAPDGSPATDPTTAGRKHGHLRIIGD